MTKKFILDTLLPYKENPETCGDNGKGCVYLTEDNKTCAIGKHMKPGDWQNYSNNVSALFKKYKQKDIMSEEWCKQRIPYKVAEYMQLYHDNIARGFNNMYVVKLLEKHTGFNLNKLN